MRNQDTFRGCLIGGAAGDALGYAVEFVGEGFIFRKFGSAGITEYALTQGIAPISDDTQMTLFTANGLLLDAGQEHKGPDPYTIWLCYRDWLVTQEMRFTPNKPPRYAWIGKIPELNSPRAPGNTCLHALHSGVLGSVDKPINESKGCGGVMRVAPIGLYFNDRGLDIRDICRLGAEASALTHGHTLGWLPSAALVQMIHEISQDQTPLEDAVAHSLQTVEAMWPESKERLAFTRLIEKAVDLSHDDLDDLVAIHKLGEGWVAEETLAIAVYCALKYPGDLDRALIAAVNHKGDSDSTGAVAGNIVGAQVGLSGIPSKYLDKLELRDLIIEIADDLWYDWRSMPADDERMSVWREKYVRDGSAVPNP